MTSIFEFHGSRIRIHLRTEETGGAYAMIEMWHQPNVGPSLHRHPRGPESFCVLEGSYTFILGEQRIPASPGTSLTIRAGMPHRYEVGSDGGRLLVICPPGLDTYFERVASKQVAGGLDWEFLEHGRHWT